MKHDADRTYWLVLGTVLFVLFVALSLLLLGLTGYLSHPIGPLARVFG